MINKIVSEVWIGHVPKKVIDAKKEVSEKKAGEIDNNATDKEYKGIRIKEEGGKFKVHKLKDFATREEAMLGIDEWIRTPAGKKESAKIEVLSPNKGEKGTDTPNKGEKPKETKPSPLDKDTTKDTPVDIKEVEKSIKVVDKEVKKIKEEIKENKNEEKPSEEVVEKTDDKQNKDKEETTVEKKAEENYRVMGQEDAKEFIHNFETEMIDMLVDKGEVSDDLYNDYDNGDSFIHESYTDKDYNLSEAAKLLEDLRDYEESDSGLWEGQEPRKAIATQAAYTYSGYVVSCIQDLIKTINDEWESSGFSEGEDETAKRANAEGIVQRYSK